MTPSQSLLLAPHWLQPSRFFLPLQPYFSHVTCGSWSVDSGHLGVDEACGLVQVTATQARSPRAVGLCRQLLQECGVKACAVYVRSHPQRTGMGVGAASGGQWCPKLPPSNPCQPCCQREWCMWNKSRCYGRRRGLRNKSWLPIQLAVMLCIMDTSLVHLIQGKTYMPFFRENHPHLRWTLGSGQWMHAK